MISGIALALRLPDLELSYKVLPAVLIPIATYIGGVFTEPAKRWLANRTDRKRLRNALYSELAGNLNQSLIFLSTLNYPEQFPTMDTWLRTEVYQDAITKQALLFHELPEGKTISLIYSVLNHSKTQNQAIQRESFSNCKNWINEQVKSGRLSRRLLNRHHTIDLPSVFDFRHPLVRRLDELYLRLTLRNVPRTPTGIGYNRSDTLVRKIKALYRGIPGEPTPLSPTGIDPTTTTTTPNRTAHS